MSAEPAVDECEYHGGPSRGRPPFPIFPFVCPLMFPVGFMVMMGRLRRRRRRAVEARLAQVEERLDGLEEKMSSD
jgi:hypothetical protein